MLNVWRGSGTPHISEHFTNWQACGRAFDAYVFAGLVSNEIILQCWPDARRKKKSWLSDAWYNSEKIFAQTDGKLLKLGAFRAADSL